MTGKPSTKPPRVYIHHVSADGKGHMAHQGACTDICRHYGPPEATVDRHCRWCAPRNVTVDRP